MDEFTHGGTPPKLWTKVRAPQNTSNYQSRIAALARQVEKLSWMLELMDEEPGINLEMAEYQWQYVHVNLS